MDVWIAVSGMLALLGGGAGAYVYYRKNFAPDYNLDPNGTPIPIVLPNGPTKSGNTFVSVPDGIVETLDPSGNVVDVSAGIVSPLPKGIGPSTVKGFVPPTSASVDTAINSVLALERAKSGQIF